MGISPPAPPARTSSTPTATPLTSRQRIILRAIVEAPIVVVAGGAVETPLPIQRSGPGGGGVGKYLRLHPVSGLFGRDDREIYGAWSETPPIHPALAASSAPGIGHMHRALMQTFRSTGTLIVLARDARHLSVGIEGAARLHFAAGAREVISLHARPVVMHSVDDVPRLRDRPVGPNDLPLFSSHGNGTCRIGTDPRTAGTDPHGERFGAMGGFIADGSLLPTAPGVNPQETIFALSTIVSERIASRFKAG